jgi:hypothetical protein
MKYSISFNNPLAKFITSFKNDNESNILLKLSRDPSVYNVIPDISRFYVVDESKELIRNISDINIKNGCIVIDDEDVTLPFNIEEDDIYAVYDMYAIVDTDNDYNGLEYNFFYNPLITNYKKACVFNEIINNEKLVFIKDDMYIIEGTILNMFRRFRLAKYVEDSRILYTLLDFDIPDNITSTPIDYNIIEMINFKDCGITNIIENNNDTGDYDNSSRISISQLICENDKCKFDSIYEYIPEDYDDTEEEEEPVEEKKEEEDNSEIEDEEYEEESEIEDEESEIEDEGEEIEEEEYGHIGMVSVNGIDDNDKRRMYILWELAQFDEWRNSIIESNEFKKYVKEFVNPKSIINRNVYEYILKNILQGKLPINTKEFKNDGHGYIFNTFRLQDNITEIYEMFTDDDKEDDIIRIYNMIINDPGRINIEDDYFDNYYPESFVNWVISS